MAPIKPMTKPIPSMSMRMLLQITNPILQITHDFGI
jgi:hypothetical protein